MAPWTSGRDLEQVGLAMSTDGRALTPSGACDTVDVQTVVHSAQQTPQNPECVQQVSQCVMEKQRCALVMMQWESSRCGAYTLATAISMERHRARDDAMDPRTAITRLAKHHRCDRSTLESTLVIETPSLIPRHSLVFGRRHHA
ncbi:hypothetical protein BJ912DRAFT_1065642 [Pholiota molesta]|nr:hypothetical protein BJ912DRAFT_1065642 [Pholiota molesta]